MLIGSRIKTALLAWTLLEVAALALSVHLIGWPSTLLLGVLTSALGFYVVRQAGRDSLAALKTAMGATSLARIQAPASGVLRMVGGILLILPGFVSDIAGLLLLSGSIRGHLGRRLAGAPRSPPDGIVNLDPGEWRAASEPDRSPPCEPLPGMLPGEPKSRTQQETGR
jgi:UPF0716 protein FxsA